MRLDVKALALTGAVLWGLIVMLLLGIGNLIWPGYGHEFLVAVASVYPGYDATPSVGQVVVGALYGAVDGAIAGALFGWLYNRFVSARSAP